MSTDWHVRGTYFEACNCDLACPCVFLSTPTDGECTVVIAWHIEDGQHDGVELDGLNVALAAHSPGHMLEVPWKAALYIDAGAKPEQQQALTQIFSGQAGGHPARLGEHIGKVLGVTNAEIQYQADGKRRSLKIENVADVLISATPGQGEADIVVENHPLCVSPGYPAVVAKSEKLHYQDHGIHWEITDKNGFYSPFSYQPA